MVRCALLNHPDSVQVVIFIESCGVWAFHLLDKLFQFRELLEEGLSLVLPTGGVKVETVERLKHLSNNLLSANHTERGLGVGVEGDGGPTQGVVCPRGEVTAVFDRAEHLNFLHACVGQLVGECEPVIWHGIQRNPAHPTLQGP